MGSGYGVVVRVVGSRDSETLIPVFATGRIRSELSVTSGIVVSGKGGGPGIWGGDYRN